MQIKNSVHIISQELNLSLSMALLLEELWGIKENLWSLEEGAGYARRIQGVIRSCRQKIRKEKVQVEFNLVNHWCTRSLKNIFIIQQLKERQRKSPCFIEHGGGPCQQGQDKGWGS